MCPSQGVLMTVSQSPDEYPGLTLERCALAHDFGDKDAATDGLRNLVARLGDRLKVFSSLKQRSRSVTEKIVEDTKILARCLHTLGDYVKHGDLVSAEPDCAAYGIGAKLTLTIACRRKSSLLEAQAAYEKSAELEPTAKGLRKLANVNLQIIEIYNASAPEPTDEIVGLAVAVIDTYALIIEKSTYFPLQDILGITTIIFKYGHHEAAAVAARRAFETLSIDCWLEVVPQLTAQLNHPSKLLQPVIEKHMQRLARAHPHSMLSNLAAVAQYPSKQRAEVANRLLNVMRLYDEDLVQQVSHV